MTPSRGRPGVVHLWGEHPFLLREAAVKLFEGHRATEIDARAWTPGATSDLATPSLLGEPRNLLVAEAQHLSDDALAEVAAYAASPAPDALLVLTTTVATRATAPPATLRRALPTVDTRRVAVDRRDLPDWIRRLARERGISATPPGAAALVETLGEDPATLLQAVTQLAEAFPGAAITPETVASQFRGLGERRIWELCDQAFGRDPAAALRSLAAMLAAREEPLAMLGGIASRLRDLIRTRAVPASLPPRELAKAAGLRFDWQARRYAEQARRFRDGELEALHERVVEADRVMKQGAAGDVVLVVLVAAIAVERAPAGRG